MGYTKEHIDAYIFRELPQNEYEMFTNAIQDDAQLAETVEDREEDLIHEYIVKELEGDLLAKFERRMNTDTSFKEAVDLTKSMYQAAKDIKRREELKAQIAATIKKFEHDKKSGEYKPITTEYDRTLAEQSITEDVRNDIEDVSNVSVDPPESFKEIYPFDVDPASADYSSATLEYDQPPQRLRKKLMWSVLAIAAVISLFFVVFNPLGDYNKIDSYIASAGDPIQINIVSLPTFGDRGSAEQPADQSVTGTFKLSIIDNPQLSEKYFIRDQVLYTNIKESNLTVLERINTEGQLEMFLCFEDNLYKFSTKEQNKILSFEQITNPELIKYCRY